MRDNWRRVAGVCLLMCFLPQAAAPAMAMRTASARWVTDWLRNRVVDEDRRGPEDSNPVDIFYVTSVLSAMATGETASDLPDTPSGDVDQMIRVVSGQAVRVGVVPVAPPEAAGVEAAPETRLLVNRAALPSRAAKRVATRSAVRTLHLVARTPGFVISGRSPNECPQGP